MKLLIIILILAGQSLAQDKPIENGWEGIKVFRTTRAEVERILGVPSENITSVETSYRTKEGIIHFAYSHAPCSDEGRGRYTVHENTVLGYMIFLKDGIDLSKFRWDRKLYEKYKDTELLWLTHYRNPKDGIRFTTEFRGDVEKIFTIYFEKTVECSKKLTCEKYK